MNLTASKNPEQAIERAAYNGQLPNMRIYKEGYEYYMNELPILKPGDPFIEEKFKLTEGVMDTLRDDLLFTNSWIRRPEQGGFLRYILGIDEEEGNELVVASWGDGFTSPVHGHSPGYIYEGLIYGKVRVNTYRIVDAAKRIVKPLRVDIIDESKTFVSIFSDPLINRSAKRAVLVHNFTSIGESATLHYLPEHTRDGKDNGFSVQYLEDILGGLESCDVKQISSDEAMTSKNGDVILVRSSNVPDYGDHFIVVTGKPIMKPHGLRIQEVVLPTSPSKLSSQLLDKYCSRMGVILLKLKPKAAEEFLRFHSIRVEGGNVHFPSHDA